MELIGVKPELVVCLTRQGDSVPEEEKNNKKAAQHFLNSGVSLKQLTQIVDCSEKFLIVSKGTCKVYMRKMHPVNSNPS